MWKVRGLVPYDLATGVLELTISGVLGVRFAVRCLTSAKEVASNLVPPILRTGVTTP
jgi:hypothetical protein